MFTDRRAAAFVLQAEVKRRTEADRQIQSHFDSEIKALQVRLAVLALWALQHDTHRMK